MIKDKQVAIALNNMILQMGADLDRSLLAVKASCSDSEFVAYREFVSSLLNTMLLDFMNPLYKQHPDLKPPELN